MYSKLCQHFDQLSLIKLEINFFGKITYRGGQHSNLNSDIGVILLHSQNYRINFCKIFSQNEIRNLKSPSASVGFSLGSSTSTPPGSISNSEN